MNQSEKNIKVDMVYAFNNEKELARLGSNWRHKVKENVE